MSNNDDVKIYIPIRQRKKVVNQENVIIEEEKQEIDYNKLGDMIIRETLNLLGNSKMSLILKKENDNK